MSFLNFLVGNGARLAYQATKSAIEKSKEATAQAAERQSLLAREHADRLHEVQEPNAVTFVPVSGELVVSEVKAGLPAWLWGGVPPCSYCATPLNLVLAEAPEILWTRVFKKPPLGARDMRIVVQEGWSVHGPWQVACAPCTNCGLQHETRAGSFEVVQR